LASCHPNGYVREAALHGLSTNDERTLPFVLLRLNDWVAPIRSLALERLRGWTLGLERPN
jgi:hypothetical protein